MAGVLSCIITGKNVFSGMLYGILIGMLSVGYLVLDFAYRKRE